MLLSHKDMNVTIGSYSCTNCGRNIFLNEARYGGVTRLAYLFDLINKFITCHCVFVVVAISASIKTLILSFITIQMVISKTNVNSRNSSKLKVNFILLLMRCIYYFACTLQTMKIRQ